LRLSNANEKHVLKDYVSFIQKSSLMRDITIVTGSLYLLAEIRMQILSE